MALKFHISLLHKELQFLNISYIKIENYNLKETLTNLIRWAHT